MALLKQGSRNLCPDPLKSYIFLLALIAAVSNTPRTSLVETQWRKCKL